MATMFDYVEDRIYVNTTLWLPLMDRLRILLGGPILYRAEIDAQESKPGPGLTTVERDEDIWTAWPGWIKAPPPRRGLHVTTRHSMARKEQRDAEHREP